MSEKVIGVIGGSGLYEMEGLTDVREEVVATPFGDPSDLYITGTLNFAKHYEELRASRFFRAPPTAVLRMNGGVIDV